jgi:hypothetical protein
LTNGLEKRVKGKKEEKKRKRKRAIPKREKKKKKKDWEKEKKLHQKERKKRRDARLLILRPETPFATPLRRAAEEQDLAGKRKGNRICTGCC